MRNIALRLRYDGSRYHGWQVQKNAVTVAQTLEEALAAAPSGATVKLLENIDYSTTYTERNARDYANDVALVEVIPLAVNARLPEDIAVTGAVEAEEEFNAILSCRKKEYIYKILNSRIPDPFLSQRVCFWPQNLDIAMIAEAAEAFVGTHDFRAVRSLGTETRTTVRTVWWCRAEKDRDLITISICADGFLYNMCRAMVGTMVYAAYGKLLPSEIPELLEKGDRRLTGPTMPPQGLYLNRVWYDGAVGNLFEDC